MEENNFFGEKDSFEDIISDTSKVNNTSNSNMEFFDTYSDSKYFKKKRRGIAKIWGAFTDWWKLRKTWQKSVMITSLCFILVIGILATVLFTVFDYNYNEITEDPDDLGFEEVIDENIINVALFGIDTRDKNSFKGLSDSIMILSLNAETKTVKIISVMRDSLVPITYNGKTTYAKINSAYSKGGPELAIKTLNTIFGLDISEYATVNFFGMVDIIDAVGGVEVELTKAEITAYSNINDCIVEICNELGESVSAHRVKSAGKQTLNGIQAVAYSRMRHIATIWGTNNDYGRTDRQRHVMEQLFNKAITLDKSQYVKLAKALIPCAETSLSYSDIMSLATSILLHSPSFEQTRVPLTEYQMGSKSVAGSGSCVYYDLDYAEKIIHAFIYDNVKPEDYMEENGIEKNDWYKGGSGSGSGGSSNGGSSSSGSSSNTTSSNSTTNNQTTEDNDDKKPDDKQNSSSSSKTENSSSSNSSSSSNNSVTNDDDDKQNNKEDQDKDKQDSENSGQTGNQNGGQGGSQGGNQGGQQGGQGGTSGSGGDSQGGSGGDQPTDGGTE